MQAIAGIPYYYRRFGYEMAVYMGWGRRIYVQDVPAKPSSSEEARTLHVPTVCAPPRRLTPASSRIWTAGEGDATCSPHHVTRGSGATRLQGATPRATSHWR